MKKLLALFLAAVLMLPTAFTATALPIFTGENDGSTVEIYDGVYFTKLGTSSGSTYGLQKVNIVEFDLKDKTLDLEILKRESIAAKYALTTYTSLYEASNSGSEVIAAVNGDLWMTGVHSNSQVTTQILTIPRGVLVNDGIVYCSSQIANECTYTTNGEGFVYFWAFGITNDYVPMIGQPLVSLDVSNVDKNTTTTTLALNRLPAHDSLVVYTSDLTNNYALADAYEIELTDIEGEFRFGGKVKGTVSAIYPAESQTKATLGAGKVVLTARGTAIEDVKDYVIGDKVEIDVSVSDVSGRDNNWEDAKVVIGGHMPSVLDGASTGIADNSNYPATIVGWKNDGKLFFLQNDGRNAQWSLGFKISNQDEFLLEMGVNSCMNLDGGGSSTMVVDGELVNRPSDGAIRSVINGIALVTTTDRVEQGDFEIDMPLRYDASYLRFDNEAAVKVVDGGYRNDATASLVAGNLRLTVPVDSIDPYINYTLSGGIKTLSADEYKYIIMKYKTSESVTTPATEYFLCAGSVTGATGGKSVKFNHTGTPGEWTTHVMDLTEVSYWTGDIYSIRLDFFAGNAKAGEYMDIEYIALAKTEQEAMAYVNGTATLPVVPEEDNSIYIADGCDYQIEGDSITNVPYGTTVYKFVKNLNGPKLEVRDAEGNVVRKAKVQTGYTVRSYDINLEVCDEYTIVVNEPGPDYSEEESSEEESTELPVIVPNEGNLLFQMPYTVTADTAAIPDDGVMATNGLYRGDGVSEWNGDLKGAASIEWMGTGKSITYTFNFDQPTNIDEIVFKSVRIASNRAFGTLVINDSTIFMSGQWNKTPVEGAPLYGDTNDNQYFDISAPVELNGITTLKIMVVTDMYCCQFDEIEAYGPEGDESSDVDSSEEVSVETSEELSENASSEEFSENTSSEELSDDVSSDDSSDNESSEDVSDRAYGDANGDGAVNSLDAAQTLKHDAKLITLDGVALLVVDVNGDGVVNSLDAAQILKLDAKLIESFPVEDVIVIE